MTTVRPTLWTALLLVGVGVGARAATPVTPEGRRTWGLVQEALVLEALEGDPARSTERWERLVRSDLPAGDPSLAEALVRLAEARWETGDVAGAREALDHCIRSGLDRVHCADLRAGIDLEVDGVHAVPVRWTFDTADHGFFHPRPFWPKGSIRLAAVKGEGSVLAWTTAVDAISPDELVVGFRDPAPEPTTIRFRLRSQELPATLGLELVDVEGRRYVPRTRPAAVPPRTWTTVELRLADLVPLEAGAPPLAPRLLYRLVVRDLTGVTGQVGRNDLWFDDFEVR